MQTQQSAFLKSAAINAVDIVDQRISQNNSELKDTIDDEVAGCSTDVSFKNNINKSNFRYCHQVRDIWKKTDRAIDEGQLTKSKEYIKAGKNLTNKRMEVLRIADREGWDTALAYLSDDLVADPESEKRLKKARRTAQASRENKKQCTSSYHGVKRTTDRKTDGNDWKDKNSNTSPSFKRFRNTDSKTCWSCCRLGHMPPNFPYRRNKYYK